MVQAQHRMATELEHLAQRVADNRRAKVTHVHLLGDVGRGVVDDHALRGHRQRHRAARLVRDHPAQLLLHEWHSKLDVEEARACDLDRLAHVLEAQPRDNVLGDVARLRLERLAKWHRHVALVVTELGPRRRHQHRVSIGVLWPIGLDERRTHSLAEPRGRIECRLARMVLRRRALGVLDEFRRAAAKPPPAAADGAHDRGTVLRRCSERRAEAHATLLHDACRRTPRPWHYEAHDEADAQSHKGEGRK